jgi:probable HAF family extracellular repeat protein
VRRFALFVVGFLILAGIVAAVSGGATRAETRWVITDLGTLGKGHWGSYAAAINDRGQIVGMSLNHEAMFVYGGRPFLWEKGKMRDLGALRGLRYGEAWDINESGRIVGSSFSIDDDNGRLDRSRATLWEGGRARMLQAGDSYQSEAMAINDKGVIVGWDDGSAVLWQGGAMRRLVAEGLATGINDRTQVVGIIGSEDPNGRWGPLSGFVWENGSTHDLGKLGGFGWRDSHDNWIGAISDEGVIVGGRNGHATVWTAEVPRRLPEARNEPRQRSWANSLNERGQIVGGWQRTSDGRVRAALWQNGKLTLLPGLPGGRDSAEAYDINERGQIVGWASAGKRAHAVLWTLGRG